LGHLFHSFFALNADEYGVQMFNQSLVGCLIAIFANKKDRRGPKMGGLKWQTAKQSEQYDNTEDWMQV